MTTTSLTPEQITARRQGIGGSDAAAVLGASPYKTPHDVYLEKIGQRPPVEANAGMKRGIYLEPVAADLYSEITGRQLRRQPQRTHRDHPWMMGNVDRQILAGEGGVAETGILEIKCPMVHTFAKIKREGLPLNYAIQMQHYLAVYGYDWGSFAAFNADRWELIKFDVEADRTFHEALINQEEKFWREHVEARVPPAEVRVQIDLSQLPKPEGEIVHRDDPEFAEAVATFKEARSLKETAEFLEQAAKAKMKEIIGGFGAVEGAGVRVYFAQRNGRKTFDKDALVKAAPLDRGVVFGRLADLLHDVGGDHPAILSRLSEVIGGATLDLSAFDKIGKPFEDFRVYPVRLDREEE